MKYLWNLFLWKIGINSWRPYRPTFRKVGEPKIGAVVYTREDDTMEFKATFIEVPSNAVKISGPRSPQPGDKWE